MRVLNTLKSSVSFVNVLLMFVWHMLRVCAQHEPEAAAPLEVDPEPFRYRPLPPSSHVYEIVDGVVRVWSDEQARCA